ncbi:MAG: hypothetical protein ACJ0DH_10370 [bacterium]
MRFSIITCLFFLVLFIQPVAAEEAELELELGLVKIMRAGKALVFSEKGSKNSSFTQRRNPNWCEFQGTNPVTRKR